MKERWGWRRRDKRIGIAVLGRMNRTNKRCSFIQFKLCKTAALIILTDKF